MKQAKLTDIIAPSFYPIHVAVRNNKYTHYWLPGGRGSTKSTFVGGAAIPYGIMADAQQGIMSNAIVIRRYANTLSGSVVEQIKWGIAKMGQTHLWDIPNAKLEFTYKPTGQKIIFKGADDEEKLKSSKVSIGYFKYIWYEELTEFEGMEKIRSINQSLMRGGENFTIFYTYNPPKSTRNWVNQEVNVKQEDKIVHHTNYLTVPREWLGEPFLMEAEHLKEVNPTAYRHEYLGEITGAGGEVFRNVYARNISDEEIKSFDEIRHAVDFGYAVDPLAYVQAHYDSRRKRLYIFDELYNIGMSNRESAKEILDRRVSKRVLIADSAEPKSIAEYNSYGLPTIGAKKGPDSVAYGIKFLQDLEQIIIDPARCPNALNEFTNYQLKRDREGNFISVFPDENNHIIDAVRYALEADMNASGRLRTMNKRKLGL